MGESVTIDGTNMDRIGHSDRMDAFYADRVAGEADVRREATAGPAATCACLGGLGKWFQCQGW